MPFAFCVACGPHRRTDEGSVDADSDEWGSPQEVAAACFLTLDYRFGFNNGQTSLDGLWAGGNAAQSDMATITYQLKLLASLLGQRRGGRARG